MFLRQRPKKLQLFIGVFTLVLLCTTTLPGCTNNNSRPETIPLPIGYTLESYTVEKTLETACTKNSDCVTPPEYMMMSRCPFVSLCLENRCNVVCPGTGAK